jgi:hypothetical protein
MLPVVYIWRIHCRWWPVAKQTWRLEAVSYITLVLIRVVRWSNGPATHVEVLLPEDLQMLSSRLVICANLASFCGQMWPPLPLFFLSRTGASGVETGWAAPCSSTKRYVNTQGECASMMRVDQNSQAKHAVLVGKQNRRKHPPQQRPCGPHQCCFGFVHSHVL